jgi:hypothetical protein
MGMTPEEMIRAAQDALGAERIDDYKIQPTQHAQELATRAPSLAAILRHSDLSVLAEQYEEKEKQAVESQTCFKTTTNRANWAVLLTACFSALLLVLGPMKSVGGLPVPIVVAIIGVCGVISGGFGSMLVYRAREGKLLDDWMGTRAAVEALR